MSRLSPDTFDTDALDWLQECMSRRGVRHTSLSYLPHTNEPYCVLVDDPVQRRARFVRGSHLREAIERAEALERGD